MSDIREKTTVTDEYKKYVDPKENIGFLYPKNWFVQESIWDTTSRAVIVNSPEGYFWLVASYPPETDLDATAREVLNTMKGEYEHLENIPTRRTFGGHVLTGYEMNFFYLDLVNTALVLAFEERGRVWIIFQQCTERLALTGEPFSYEDVFEAITLSFLQSLSNNAALTQ